MKGREKSEPGGRKGFCWERGGSAHVQKKVRRPSGARPRKVKRLVVVCFPRGDTKLRNLKGKGSNAFGEKERKQRGEERIKGRGTSEEQTGSCQRRGKGEKGTTLLFVGKPNNGSSRGGPFVADRLKNGGCEPGMKRQKKEWV